MSKYLLAILLLSIVSLIFGINRKKKVVIIVSGVFITGIVIFIILLGIALKNM